MPSRGSFDITAVLSTTESPCRSTTAPFACSATLPVSIESRRPATSTFFVTAATRYLHLGGPSGGATWVRFLAAAAQALGPQRELLEADPATSVGFSRLTYLGRAFARPGY